jgi:hypothetical protein
MNMHPLDYPLNTEPQYKLGPRDQSYPQEIEDIEERENPSLYRLPQEGRDLMAAQSRDEREIRSSRVW